MNRLGIFTFYDPEGIVDDYINSFLDSIQVIVHQLIIIINGDIKKQDCQKLKKYTQHIFIRDNLGYDAGAYKDCFTKFLSYKDLEKYDEIVLFNDTFYGAIHPLQAVFLQVNQSKTDFWGLSRHPGGEGKLSSGDEMPQHIQSFFLVCRKSLFLSSDWINFWEKLEYPSNYQDAVENFEIGFSNYFTKKGYLNKAYTDIGCTKIIYGRNPCIYCFYDLIRQDKFPVLKRRTFSLIYFEELKKTFNYIEAHTNFNTKIIYSHIKRLNNEGRISLFYPFSKTQLERFYNTHDRIFIYGHGKYGKGLAIYFEYRGWNYEGFIVSERENENAGIYTCKDIQFDCRDGIILALGRIAFRQVYPVLKSELEFNQLLLPQYVDS